MIAVAQLSPGEQGVLEDVHSFIVPNASNVANDWESIAAIVYLSADERGLGNSCFAFDCFGFASAFAVPCEPLKRLLIALRDRHVAYPARKWIKALIHMDAEAPSFVTFEFHDLYRWDVRPDNFRSAIRAIRPSNYSPATPAPDDHERVK